MKRCGAVSVSGKEMSKYDSNKQHNANEMGLNFEAYRKVGKDENTNQNCSTDLSVAQQNGFGFILFAVDKKRERFVQNI